MKKLSIVLVLFLIFETLNAQENSSYVDSILNLVINNQLTIFDTEFKEIKNINVNKSQTDTVISDLWTRPRFVDNIFHASFDGVIVKSPILYDTSTNLIRADFLEFKVTQFDENGNYKSLETKFLIDKNEVEKRNKPSPKKTFNKPGKTWRNDEIIINEKKVELDSCHSIFRIRFSEDFSFNQHYGKDSNSCSTKEMNEHITVGLEGEEEELIKFYDLLQGHFLTTSIGFWRFENKKLYLFDQKWQRINSFYVLNFSEDELVLKLLDRNYILKMKRVY